MRDLFAECYAKDPASKKGLRAYQSDAIHRLKLSLKAKNRRPVLQLPTGGGKTLVAASIISMAREKGKRVAFFVPALSLVDQTVAAFRAEGIDHIGVMQADHPDTDITAPVQVATVQTFGARKAKGNAVPSFDFAIVDECHIRSRALEAEMLSDPNKIFVGLSATPWAQGMALVWDDLIVGTTIGDLIEQGYLSRFRAYASAHPDLSGVGTVAGEYHQGQLGEAMRGGRLTADVVETWLRHGDNRPTLCFAVDRAHAAKLQADFEAAGVPAGYVDAFTDSIERELIRHRFEAGALKVVCNCRTLTTGVDWAVGCIIDAAPTRSKMLHVQKIGRGLRVNDGIPDCIILDHASNSIRLGLVTDIHQEHLSDGKKADTKREKSDPLPKECGKCGYLKAPKVHACPSCGFVPERTSSVETEEGELVEITGGAKKATREDKQRWWSAIQSERRRLRRSSGWAAHTYRDKFGVWPKGLSDDFGPVDEEVAGFIRHKDIAFAKRRQA